MSKAATSAEDSSKKAPKKEKAPAKSQGHGIMDEVMDRITKAISHADEAAAAERVDNLRTSRPEATPTELVEILIRQKCLQTGAVGAVTSGASMIPGLGTMVSLTFGVAADIGLTFKMQAELVLEIAAAHGHQLSPTEKRNAVLIVTGISSGANKLLEKAGEQIAKRATEQLAEKSIAKAIPVLGVAASAGSNILSTYIIGQRANAYFSLGPEAVGDWGESLRALTGVDKRVIIGWLTETTERSWELASSSVQNVADAVIGAGKSAGEVVVFGAEKAGEAVAGAGRGLVKGVEIATEAVTDTSKKVGGGIVSGAQKTGEFITDSGKGVVTGASNAGQAVVNTGRKAGQGLATGAKKTGDLASEVGHSVVAGAENTTGAVISAGKKVGGGLASGTSKAGKSLVEGADSAKQGLASAAGKVGGIFKRRRAKEAKEADVEVDAEREEER